MNYAKQNIGVPNQEVMKSAQYNQNIYPYYYPFTPVDEEFRQISRYLPEYRDYFWVSNYGRVYNANSGYLVVPHQNINGYLTAAIRKKSDLTGTDPSQSIGIHILVCTCFNGPKPGPRHQVNHKDFNRTNNYAGNLEWMTSQENLDYSRAAGNYWDGNVYSSATRNEADIRKICELMQSGITDPQTLSRMVYGCDVTPALYSLFQDIRTGGWYMVTKDYSIPELEHRNFTGDEYIHAMCRYMVDNPGTAYSANIDEVLGYSGLAAYSDTDPKFRNRMSSALNQLRYKGAYKRIASQYNLPGNPTKIDSESGNSRNQQ